MGPRPAQGRGRLPHEEPFRVHAEETAGRCGGICRARGRLLRLPPRGVYGAQPWRTGWTSANVFVT
jgi:hypothetical protein